MVLVLATDLSLAYRERSRVRFMIGRVNERRAVGFETVAQRESRVIEVARHDANVVDLECAFDKVMVADGGSKLLQCDREICILHLSRQGFANRLIEALGPINIPFIARRKQRSK